MKKVTDFNDSAAILGKEAVERRINDAVSPPGAVKRRRRKEQQSGDVTEASVARMLADENLGRLIFDHRRERWLTFDGAIWCLDETGVVPNLILELCERSGDKRLERYNSIRGIEGIARTLSEFVVGPSKFDADPFLLGTPAGPVDLRTGLLLEPDPASFITKTTSCAPEPMDIPRWRQFLDECTGGDPALIRFLQQVAGYCLTGDTREQCLWFIYGAGRNGKGVFLRALAGILGTYAHRAQIETFSAGPDRHPTDIAAMEGKRLVFSSETERRRNWAESRIKDLTGGDPIRARFMRQDEFEYRPCFKIVISGNHRPVIESCDEAMRSRLYVVPFDQTFAGAKTDKMLDEKLKAECPGILRWAIDGCLDWQQNGFTIPEKVWAATAEYFDQQDVFAQWLEQETIRGPELEDTSTRLYRSWTLFAKDNGENPGSQKSLAERLQRAGFRAPTPTRRDGKGVRVWTGLKAVIQ